MAKQCQSCGMPLKKEEDFGTEKDGGRSEKFCSLCYENGGFIDPNITLEEMQEIVDGALKDQHWPKFLRKMATRQTPKLERWQ